MPPLELLDSMDKVSRQSVITRAIRSYTITLMTRAYGRGTDFICRDEGLKKNGGVHVITTFYPEHESENKQINGRTCRQDDQGSARKIIFEEDLKVLGASDREFQSSGLGDQDIYLDRKRCAMEEKVYESMTKQFDVMLSKHNLAKQTCDAAMSEDWDSARRGFLELNDAITVSDDLSHTSSFHTIFVLDGSGSMEGNLIKRFQFIITFYRIAVQSTKFSLKNI